jgi:ankyrin repeat protein
MSKPSTSSQSKAGNRIEQEKASEKPPDEASLQSIHDTMKMMLELKEDRKKRRHWESDRQRRAIHRRHLVDAGSALAIVAALIGGGVLEVLLSPAWAQVSADTAVGACSYCGECFGCEGCGDACETWRSIFLGTASTAFCLDILALLLTVGAIMGVSRLLSLAIVIFVFALDFIAVSLVATSWLAYARSAAIAASCLMGVLMVLSLVVCWPLFSLAWYLLRGKATKLELPKYNSDIFEKGDFIDYKYKRYKLLQDVADDALEREDFISSAEVRKRVKKELKKEEVLMGTSLIHYLSYTRHWLYRFLHYSLLEIILAGGEDPDKKADDGTTPLMVAALSNNINIAELLLAEGADPNIPNKAGWSAMMLACQEDRTYKNIVQLLINAGGDLNALEPLRKEPVLLTFAAICGDIELLEKVLSNGNVDGNPAFIRGAGFGPVEVVQWLLEHSKIDVNAVDSDGETALMKAARYGRLEIVQELLKLCSNMDVNAVDFKGQTALIIAMWAECVEIVQELLKHSKIDVNAVDFKGETALMKARLAGRNRAEILQELLKHSNLDVNVVDSDGKTALMRASRDTFWGAEIVHELIKHSKIDVNVVDSDGKTALMEAARYKRLEIVQELLKHSKIDVNAVDSDGKTALMEAVLVGHLEMVQELLKHPDIDINHADSNEFTPLLASVIATRLDIMRALLKHEKMNHGNANNVTALHLAAFKGQLEVMELILGVHGIDVNARVPETGKTALHLAAREGHLTVVQRLVADKTIDISLQDVDGKTALHLSEDNGHRKIAKLLAKLQRKRPPPHGEVEIV